ncbi:MAG: RNA polymerase sigma factor [Steroidobacteraceae bacterium]
MTHAIAGTHNVLQAEPLEFPDPAQRDDATLAAAAHGDQRAFERLYRQHAGNVHGLCLRMTGRRDRAEDCTQETFIAAWRALPGFEQRSRFGTWLHRIAVNTVLNSRRGLAASAADAATTLDDGALEVIGERDAAGPIDLEQAIARLPEGARHVLVLVGLYGHSHEEAADMLGLAVGTTKAQLHRARRLLAAHLDLDPETT